MTSGPSDEDVAGQVRTTIGQARLLMNKKGRFEQGGNSIDIFWLEFQLKKPLEFLLEIPYTTKKCDGIKMESRAVFHAKTLLNCQPGPLTLLVLARLKGFISEHIDRF